MWVLARPCGGNRVRGEGRDHPARHQRDEKGEEVERQQRARVDPRQCGQTGMIQVEQHVGYPEKGRHRRHGKVPVVARPDDRNRDREAGQEQAIDDDGQDRWSGNDLGCVKTLAPRRIVSVQWADLHRVRHLAVFAGVGAMWSDFAV